MNEASKIVGTIIGAATVFIIGLFAGLFIEWVVIRFEGFFPILTASLLTMTGLKGRSDFDE